MFTLKGRDENGYPTEGLDVVPERKTNDVLSTVVELLKESNQRSSRLQDEKDYWYHRYQDLNKDYIALKYDDSCQQCLTPSKQGTSGELSLCEECKSTIRELKKELERQEKVIRYWQECYETTLQHLS